MQATVPDSQQIDRILSRFAATVPPSDVELAQILGKPIIVTGLDHWALWTLICLTRHLDRQKWVGYIVESKLKGDLRQIGCAGSWGHPGGVPQSGKVPDEDDWRYFFHGAGCCLTNDHTGESVDVDFTKEGACDRIDWFFYSNFLASLSQPDFPEKIIYRAKPLEHSWQVEVERLSAANCVEAKTGIKLTALGFQVAEALEPLTGKFAKLLEWDTVTANRNAVYAALAIGDVMLASQIALRTDVCEDLKTRISQEVERAKISRCRQLKTALREENFHLPSYLSALADLGPKLSEEAVLDRLFQIRVDGAANQALQILCAWNQSNLIDILKQLLTQRYNEATVVGLFLRKLFISNAKNDDRHPRNYQIVNAMMALLQRVGCDTLGGAFKRRLRFLIERTGGAQAGASSLLLYLLDKQSGLRALAIALSGKIPAARNDAAAACVIIGDEHSKQILIQALQNPDSQIQHTVACALAAFPSVGAKEFARAWFAQNDGIQHPLGQEATLLGRTSAVFTFADISHANMDVFFNSALERLRKEFKSIL